VPGVEVINDEIADFALPGRLVEIERQTLQVLSCRSGLWTTSSSTGKSRIGGHIGSQLPPAVSH
jgi:hypothetical protein